MLITGAAGAGKSGLALALMGLGCDLVADDRVCLTAHDGQLIATAPEALRGMIEARGLGLLRADAVPEAALVLAVDLDQMSTERLPARRDLTLLGCTLPLIYRADTPQFAAAIRQLLQAGWSER